MCYFRLACFCFCFVSSFFCKNKHMLLKVLEKATLKNEGSSALAWAEVVAIALYVNHVFCI